MYKLPLDPSDRYLEYHKNGNLNLAGSIRNVLADLNNGTTFSGSAVDQFLRDCGATVDDMSSNYHRNGVSTGKVVSSLGGLANRESGLTKRFTDYYEITRPQEETGSSSISNPEPKKEMTLEEFNELMFG